MNVASFRSNMPVCTQLPRFLLNELMMCELKACMESAQGLAVRGSAHACQ